MAESFKADKVLVEFDAAYLDAAGSPLATIARFVAAFQDSEGATFRFTPLTTFKTVDPTVNDDADDGYIEGAIWVNTTDLRVWFLLKATPTAADWRRVPVSTDSVPMNALPFDWDSNPVAPPVEVVSGDILTFEFQDAGPIRSVIGAVNYPNNQAPIFNPVLIVPLVVTVTGAGNGNVVLRLHAKYIASGELTTKADDETINMTVPLINTLHQKHEVEFVLDKTLISAGDYVSFKLERIHTDAADTFTGRFGVTEIAEFDPGL